MAGMFDAIIIPFSSVGIAESVNIFFDKEGDFDFDLHSCSRHLNMKFDA